MKNDNNSSSKNSSEEPVVVIPEVLPVDGCSAPKHKIKGAAQMAAGAALTTAGVPMLVLPGPGAAAIAGGAALISKGQRNYTGRVATPLEEKLDDVAEKAAVAVKNSAKKTAYKTVEAAPKVVKKAIHEVPEVAGAIFETAKPIAANTATKAVKTGGQLAEKGLEFIREKKNKKG